MSHRALCGRTWPLNPPGLSTRLASQPAWPLANGSAVYRREVHRFWAAVGRFLKQTRLVHSFGWGSDVVNLALLTGALSVAELGWLGGWLARNPYSIGLAFIAVLFLVAGVRLEYGRNCNSIGDISRSSTSLVSLPVQPTR